MGMHPSRDVTHMINLIRPARIEPSMSEIAIVCAQELPMTRFDYLIVDVEVGRGRVEGRLHSRATRCLLADRRRR